MRIRCGLVLLACLTASALMADLRNGKEVFKSGNWTVLRDQDPMSDKVVCTGIYQGDFKFQLTEHDFYVRILGGVQSVRLRFDDEPAQALRLASEMEKKINAVDIKGADFERVLTAKRLRMQVGTLIRGLNEIDLDLIGLREAHENISGGCPDTGAVAQPKAAVPVGLCPRKVMERLKARGLSTQAIDEICRP